MHWTKDQAGNNQLQQHSDFTGPERLSHLHNQKSEHGQAVSMEKLRYFHCQNQTTAKCEGQRMATNQQIQTRCNKNNSKSINSVTTKPITTEIRLISVVVQIRRCWTWFLATNTPHFTTFHMPFGAHQAVKGFVATRTLVSGLADVSPGTPTMHS